MSPSHPPRSCVTSRNKVHLSAPTDLNPKTGSIVRSLENNWEDAVKAPAPSRHPTPASSLPLGEEIMGKTVQASEPKLGAGAGGREDTRPVSSTNICHQDTPSPQEPRCSHSPSSPLPHQALGWALSFQVLFFDWFILFSFFKQQLSECFLYSTQTFLPEI